MHARAIVIAAALAAASAAQAQWDPQNGQWGKSHETDLRVMTWNIHDVICTTNPQKTDAAGPWNAIVRIVADLQPDVLIIQEAGDNDGNGSGFGVDTSAELEEVCHLFVEGGFDPYTNTQVTSYVKAFAADPNYDLPYIFAASGDSYNRNVILSRYPFSDLNGDNLATYFDFFISQGSWAQGNGGIRGFGFAEIDLPDGVYAGDVVIGNSHLKSGGTSSDYSQRLTAATNIAYLIQYYYNGNGTGMADPENGILSPFGAADALDANTPMIWGGDWNEDESKNGRKGPAEWMTQAQVAGGTDGTDRDGTDSTYDNASHPISGSTATQSSSKLDYIAWQDSIATARRQFLFRTTGSGVGTAQIPPATSGWPGFPSLASEVASDHRPVIVDFILPLAPTVCSEADLAAPFGVLNFADVQTFLAAFGSQQPQADLAAPQGMFNFADVQTFLALFGQGC